MKFSAHTIRRFASFAGLAAVVAAVAVPTAFAHPATEGGDDTSRTAVVLDHRSPDTRDISAQYRGGGLDPAIATAMAGHQRLGDHRSPDTRDVAANLIAQDRPVAVPASSDGTNWGLVAAMFAAIGTLFVGVGVLAVAQGHGKSHGTVKPA